jgi:hypothetical protein
VPPSNSDRFAKKLLNRNKDDKKKNFSENTLKKRTDSD